MSDESPDWEIAARRAVASDIADHGEGVRDECYGLAGRLDEGQELREEDVEQLQKRIEELEHQLDYLLAPIATDNDHSE